MEIWVLQPQNSLKYSILLLDLTYRTTIDIGFQMGGKACIPNCAKTLKEVKDETGGKGVSEVTIAWSESRT